jgi:hypothetical protein
MYLMVRAKFFAILKIDIGSVDSVLGINATVPADYIGSVKVRPIAHAAEGGDVRAVAYQSGP